MRLNHAPTVSPNTAASASRCGAGSARADPASKRTADGGRCRRAPSPTRRRRPERRASPRHGQRGSRATRSCPHPHHPAGPRLHSGPRAPRLRAGQARRTRHHAREVSDVPCRSQRPTPIRGRREPEHRFAHWSAPRLRKQHRWRRPCLIGDLPSERWLASRSHAADHPHVVSDQDGAASADNTKPGRQGRTGRR